MYEELAQKIFSQETLINPEPVFEILRAQAPVQRVAHPLTGKIVYLVTSYETVLRILQAPDDFSNNTKELLYGGLGGFPEADVILANAPARRDVMQLADEPSHRTHRSLVARAFTPSRVSKLGEFIDRAANDLLDEFSARGQCEFVEDFAARLPVRIIAKLLGIPEGKWDDLRRWTDAYVVRLSQHQTREEDIAAAEGMVEALAYFQSLILERRTLPGEDLITDVVETNSEREQPLDDTELLSLVEQVAIGAASSSRDTIGGGVLLFLQNPDQLAKLRQDWSLLPNAVEEILRHFTAVTSMWRVARRDTEIGGVMIPEGAAVLTRLDSANHDAAHFAHADQFDITRPPRGDHVGFGQGIHYCLGQMLARRELAASLKSIFGRLQHIRIDEDSSDLSPHVSIITRGTRRICLTFDPAAPLNDVRAR